MSCGDSISFDMRWCIDARKSSCSNPPKDARGYNIDFSVKEEKKNLNSHLCWVGGEQKLTCTIHANHTQANALNCRKGEE